MNSFVTLLLLLLTVFLVDTTTEDLESYSTNDCSHAFFSRSRTFSAPSTSNRCIWRITVPPQEKILLNITDLNIPKTPNCLEGHIEIRDGYWQNSPLLGKFCGESRLNPIISSTNKMLISYVNYNPGGFDANYESICGDALFVEYEASFRSPNYPDFYPNKQKCYWAIAVPEDRRVVLTFQNFDVEYGFYCSYDYVEIRDGLSSRTFCNGRPPPSPFIANSSFVLVKFVSDFSVRKRGFLAVVNTDVEHSTTDYDDYDCLDCAQECTRTADGYECACQPGYYLHPNGRDCVLISDVCGGNHVIRYPEDRYSIASPLYPSRYPLNTTCIWNISTPLQERRIRLTFQYFDLEEGIRPDRHSNSTVCHKDWLKVFSTVSSDFPTSSRFCSAGRNAVNQTVINHGSFCGRITPQPIISAKNNLTIVFNSDISVQRNGFFIEYKSELQGCLINNGNCHHRCNYSHSGNASCVCANGATLQSNNVDCLIGDCEFEIASLSGSISSPNYPRNYPVNKQCSWTFNTTPGHRLSITFVDFSLERTTNCLDDYVIAYDNPYYSGPVLGRFCGDFRQFQVTSSNNGLSLKFRSDHGITSRGFRASYSTVCGGNLTADSTEKYIYSHSNFGYAEYDNNVYCEWTIKATNRTVTISFLSFSLEDAGCNYDYVTVFDKINSTLTHLSGPHCSNRKPPRICSTSDTVVIRFRTDSSVTREGFSLVYKAV